MLSSTQHRPVEIKLAQMEAALAKTKQKGRRKRLKKAIAATRKQQQQQQEEKEVRGIALL